MKRIATSLVVFVIVFHVAAFALEALLWMQPGVHEPVLRRLSISTLEVHDQALLLRAFFVNQGFYNLFLACAGVTGLVLVNREQRSAGYALIAYMCLTAFGAGVVLAMSTRAYVGAFLQAVPAACALLSMGRIRR